MHCLQTIFPFTHIEDNQELFPVIMECVSDYPFQFHEMNIKVSIPLDINESTNFNEMGPDIQISLKKSVSE